jgi:hypothetical protein
MEKEQQPVLEYEKPEIVDYGDLKDLTASARTGGHLDADFSRGTPTSQLTFSG